MHRAAIAALAALGAPVAHADDSTNYRFGAYIWLPTFSASYTFPSDPPQNGESSVSLADILEAGLFLKGAVQADWGAVIGELNYLRLGDASESDVVGLGADLGLEGVMGALSYGLPVYKSNSVTLYATGGLRVWDVTLSADITPTPVSRLRDVSWVDPIVGGYLDWSVGEQWRFVGEATVGGFGAGSELQTDLVIAVRRSFAERWDAAFGYRDLRVDFEDAGIIADMTITGPMFEIGYSF